jgi:hypothetical protein
MEERDQSIEEPAPFGAPSIGDQCHYVLEAGWSQGQHRPAIIVRVWGTDPGAAVNLLVFVDGSNDQFPNNDPPGGVPLVLWRTSKLRDDDMAPGTWHWPEYPDPELPAY